MLHFRVRDLDAMLAQLRAAGVRIDSQEAQEGVGRFAWLVDPEGNRVELWEPAPDVLEPADGVADPQPH
jgi:glyoxylase I family protein